MVVSVHTDAVTDASPRPPALLWLRYALGGAGAPFACEGALAYRLASPAADHYFLINDGPARRVRLDTRAFRYRSLRDAVSGASLRIGDPVEVEAWGGRWLRFEK